MSLRTNISAIAVTIALLTTGVRAGAGAVVNACMQYDTAPIAPITVQFKAGGSADNCMNAKGKDNSVTVINAGVTCADVGYVEEKGSSSGGDTCATDDSIWTLSYNATNPKTGSKTGSTLSDWTADWFTWNNMKLKDYNAGTKVCGTSSYCDATAIRWKKGTTGPLYVIFNPNAAKQESDEDEEGIVRENVDEGALEKAPSGSTRARQYRIWLEESEEM